MTPLRCPWCGRRTLLKQDGTLKAHKSNQRHLFGTRRMDCDGAGRDPKRLTDTERTGLRQHWYAESGLPRIFEEA